MKLITRFSILFTSVIISSCSNSLNNSNEKVTPITYNSPKDNDEYVEVVVRTGANRDAVELALLQNLYGAESVTNRDLTRKHDEFIRIKTSEELESILVNRFNGGDGYVRKLWNSYPNATYSGQEADNYTIVFFDQLDKAVTAYPDSTKQQNSDPKR